MLTETGRVVGLEGDTAWVETLRHSTCGACSARSGCGHGLLNSARPGSSRALVRARVERKLIGELQLQDSVEVSLPERSFLHAAMLMYVAPLAAAIAAALAAERWLASGTASGAAADFATVLGAVGGLAAGFLAVRWLGARQSAADLLPVITARR